MECFYCKGQMKTGRASYTVNRRGYHLVLDEIPAYVCEQCGESYFESKEVRIVQEMIRELDRKSENLLQAVGS